MPLKHALRSLWMRPGFAALAIVPLALGIGLNTAIFSAVHGVLLRSLPYHDPERLVRVWEARPRMGLNAAQAAAFSMDRFRTWRESNELFEAMAVYQDASFNLTGGSEPRRIEGQRVSPALFPLLGVDPLHGRTFTEDEETPGKGAVLVSSYDLWQRLFGGESDFVGRSILLDGIPYTVVGIMPPGFRFPDPATQFWVPLAMAPLPPSRPGEFRIELVPVIARLAPGVTVAKAEAVAEAFLSNQRESSEMARQLDEGVRIHLTSLHEQLVRPIRPALLVLLAAVGLVLLIACANVANLFLVRSQRQERDVALRAALGAGRSRLVGELLADSLVVGLFGGGLGVLVAYWSVRLIRFTEPSGVSLLENVEINGSVLAFNLAVSLLAAVLVGVIPALRASNVDLVTGLKGTGSVSGRAPRRARSVLAVFEVALSLVLFVAAGLMLQSFLRLSSIDPGYEPKGVLTFRVNLPQTKYPGAESAKAFYDRLRESLSGIPGVSATGIVNTLPLDGARAMMMLNVEGRPPVEDRTQMPRASVRIVSPGFLQAMGVRLLRGRALEESDGLGSPVVVVNDALAKRYFSDEEPLGQRLSRMGEIVGIVADVRQEGLDAEPEPEIYMDYRHVPAVMGPMISQMSVAVRHDPRTPALLETVEARLREIDPDLPLADVRPMEERLYDSVARPRLYAALLLVFAALALFLAVFGVYSVVSYSVSERTRETGIRMTFGATASDIVRLVLRDGWAILLWGVAIGVGVSLFTSRFLRSFLFGIEPLDLPTFVTVSVLLSAAVLLASAVPARQAAKGDPVEALRYE